MKKILLAISAILTTFVFVACAPTIKPEEKIQDLYELVEINLNGEDTLLTVTENITLPTIYTGFEDIEVIWVSNSTSIVIDGNTGIVTRGESNTFVRISATLKLNGVQDTKHFELIVLKQEAVVIDTIKPVISGHKNYELFVGDTAPNWLEGVTANDNVDGLVEVVIINNTVNLEVVGTYEIEYAATDSSNNTATVKIHVFVRQDGKPREGVTFTENFETNNAPITTQYGNGSFTSQGITWTFNHAINAGKAETGSYQIDGGGILLRRASDSYLSATFTGGLQSFSFDWRKAFTSLSERTIEIILKDLTTNNSITYEDSMTGSGEDARIFNFNKADLLISGDWEIKIKIKGTATSNAHVTIDNFKWTTNPGEIIPKNEVDAIADKDDLVFPEHIVEPTNLVFALQGNKGSLIEWSFKNANNPNKELINLSTGNVSLPSDNQVEIILVATITNEDFTTTKEIVIKLGENLETIPKIRLKNNNSYIYTSGIITSKYETATEVKLFLENNNSAIYVVAPISFASYIIVGNEIDIKGTKTTLNQQITITNIRDITTLSTSTITPKIITSTQLNQNPSIYVQLFGLIHETYTAQTTSFVFETINGSFEAKIPSDLNAALKISIQEKLVNLSPGVGVLINATIYQDNSTYYLLLTNPDEIIVDSEIDLHTITPVIIQNITLPNLTGLISNNINLTSSNGLLFGATIEWASSNLDVLKNDGTITKQEDVTYVNLTYTIKYNGEIIKTETFELTIQSSVPTFEGYYESLIGLSGETLINQLYNILNDTGQYQTTTYGDARYFLEEADAWVDYNTDYVYLIYTDTLKGSVSLGYPDEGPALAIWDGGDTWNREHVWAKSLFGTGNYDPSNSTRGIDADLHNLRAADTTVNSTRGNNIFINQIYMAEGFGNYGSQWYPGDNHRGDVARILFYMDIRWGNMTDLSKIGDLYTLLQWHELDPVDAFEINRNNIIFSHQNNRNPFIDHPELANMIYSN